MSLNIPTVASSLELLTTLRGTDLHVPERINGRTTDHTETWTIAHLLSTLASTDRIAFPLAVTHRDRPDILIQFGVQKIGVEITEAVSEQYAAYCALAEREFPDASLEPAHFRWGAPSLSTEQMRALLRQSQLTIDGGWVGDRPEQEWALFIQSIVNVKLAKLAHQGFEKFDQNWLAIYDNLPLPDDIDLAKSIKFLCPLLQNNWSISPSFDALFIEHGSVIACITPEGFEYLPLNDLWN